MCESLSGVFKKIDGICEANFSKVLFAMHKNKLSEAHFAASTGYGYNDIGRDTLESIYADIFHTESALVRPHIISGTHALTTALFGNLRHGDEMVSLAGAPYDTLLPVIGVRPAVGSLIEHGIIYNQIDLKDGNFDFLGIEAAMESKPRLALIQRSKGYSLRRSFSPEEIGGVITLVKAVSPDTICVVDNCYGEFCGLSEPSDFGADLTVGSLIKNIGGGIAPCGGYICGKEQFVEAAAARLSAPGLGKSVGPNLGHVASLTQGLFFAPSVVCSAVKGAVLTAKIYDELGFKVSPEPYDIRHDIVQAIQFNDRCKVLAFCEGIQKAAPVDSFAAPEPFAMPGYDDSVVMAAGAFIQGSSIELSADAPMREPYNVYFQGGLVWPHAKIGAVIALDLLYKKGFVKL